jgi:hypothetical protein
MMNSSSLPHDVLRKILNAAVAILICQSAFVGFAQTAEPPAKPVPKIVRKVPVKTAPASQPSAPGRGAPVPTNGSTPSPTRTAPATSGPTVPQRPLNPSNPPSIRPAYGRGGQPAPPQSAVRVTRTPNGGEIHRAGSGRIGAVKVHGMDVHYGPQHSRMIVRERADHAVVVSNRYGYGYIQRPYNYRGAAFVRRTYYVNGLAYNRIYQPYLLAGVPLYVYAPTYYYSSPFYSWAYYPWDVPVTYSWGWMGDPWYAYYRGYFTPSAVYASPSLWLADYVMAQTLQAAYLERAAELANNQINAEPLPSDVRQMIADEVNRQIALETHEAANAQTVPDPGSSGIERMLADAKQLHIFVVSSPLYLQSGIGECRLTEGDVLGLQLGGHQPDTTIGVRVVMARQSDSCPRGSLVWVDIADLQEMQNHMRELIDQGLGELQRTQGQNGIPATTAAAQPPAQPAYADLAPPPDPNVANELKAQNSEADQALQETFNQASLSEQAVDPSMSEARLTLGKTVQEVLAIVGEKPQDVFDSGTNRIYVFSKVVVTFTGGRVVKIEE